MSEEEKEENRKEKTFGRSWIGLIKVNEKVHVETTTMIKTRAWCVYKRRKFIGPSSSIKVMDRTFVVRRKRWRKMITEKTNQLINTSMEDGGEVGILWKSSMVDNEKKSRRSADQSRNSIGREISRNSKNHFFFLLLLSGWERHTPTHTPHSDTDIPHTSNVLWVCYCCDGRVRSLDTQTQGAWRLSQSEKKKNGNIQRKKPPPTPDASWGLSWWERKKRRWSCEENISTGHALF